jgi:hypothetical protein
MAPTDGEAWEVMFLHNDDRLKLFKERQNPIDEEIIFLLRLVSSSNLLSLNQSETRQSF